MWSVPSTTPETQLHTSFMNISPPIGFCNILLSTERTFNWDTRCLQSSSLRAAKKADTYYVVEYHYNVFNSIPTFVEGMYNALQ